MDNYYKWMVKEKGKIRMKREISASVKESGEHKNTKDAEKHQSLSFTKEETSSLSFLIFLRVTIIYGVIATPKTRMLVPMPIRR